MGVRVSLCRVGKALKGVGMVGLEVDKRDVMLSIVERGRREFESCILTVGETFFSFWDG